MATKKGNGGHGMENYDPATGKYVGDEGNKTPDIFEKSLKFSDELKSVLNLSDQDIYDEDLKEKYNLTDDDIKQNKLIDKRNSELKKERKEIREEKVYSDEVEKAGDELYDYFQSIEKPITENVVSLCESLGGKMYGLDQRVKGKHSIKSKLNRYFRRGIPVEESKNNFHDGLRYTAVFNSDNFTDSVQKLLGEFEKAGYEQTYLNNRFYDEDGNVNPKYRDIIANFKTPDGKEFEIQLNTIKGICAKNGKEIDENGDFIDRRDGTNGSHVYYSERREMDDDDNSTRARYLDYQMEKLWKDIPVPKGVEKIGGKS